MLAVAYQRDSGTRVALVAREPWATQTRCSRWRLSPKLCTGPRRGSRILRFLFAHGGKDGHPFPVPIATYDASIAVLAQQVRCCEARRSRSDRRHETSDRFVTSNGGTRQRPDFGWTPARARDFSHSSMVAPCSARRTAGVSRGCSSSQSVLRTTARVVDTAFRELDSRAPGWKSTTASWQSSTQSPTAGTSRGTDRQDAGAVPSARQTLDNHGGRHLRHATMFPEAALEPAHEPAQARLLGRRPEQAPEQLWSLARSRPAILRGSAPPRSRRVPDRSTARRQRGNGARRTRGPRSRAPSTVSGFPRQGAGRRRGRGTPGQSRDGSGCLRRARCPAHGAHADRAYWKIRAASPPRRTPADPRSAPPVAGPEEVHAQFSVPQRGPSVEPENLRAALDAILEVGQRKPLSDRSIGCEHALAMRSATCCNRSTTSCVPHFRSPAPAGRRGSRPRS